jgi:cystathionine gamma-lyase
MFNQALAGTRLRPLRFPHFYRLPPMTRVLSPDPDHGFATRAIHAGQVPDPLAGAVMPPIYQTSTYIQDALGRHKGYEYARTQNPTREALERNVASLEGATHGFAFGSGLAALDAVLKLLKVGDHVVCGENVYGGSMRLMTRVYAELGLEFSFVDMREIGPIERAITPRTRMVYCETPTNPMMFLTDLVEVGDLAQARGLLYVVDNTFATPFFQRPLAFGADIVLHSTTKYLNGHSDMVGGLLVTQRDDLAERLGFLQNAAGAVPGPMDCWLALRGIKTLPLRMRQHDASGRRIAQWLTTRREVAKVYYPGLPSHPQHELACRQMTGFGGMISLDLGDVGKARRLVERVRVFSLAESLGGVESLIGHPASMTHASVPAALRDSMGLTDSLVRLSCGCEDTEDLMADLEQAFEASR